MPEHIWFLMSRNLSGEASAAENEELMQLLQEQPALQQQFDILKRWWESQHAQADHSVEPGKIEHILQRSSVEEAVTMPQQKRGIFKSMFVKVAVAALLIITAGTVIWLSTKTTATPVLHEVMAQKGSRTRTILPDGSTVWLNAGSKISYKPGLTGADREVTLEGEAFFEVVKRNGRPFIVHAREIDINVLGTAFNVKSYPNDKTIETTLIRGLVSITRSDNGQAQPVYLKPHQKFVLPVAKDPKNDNTANADAAGNQRPARPTVPQIVNLDKNIDEKVRAETAWIYDRLEFRGDTFEELAKKMERWYNINIRFEDERVKQLTFNGSLENETVDQAFKALQAAVPFQFTINDNEISVRSY
ncbi:MAG TPA: FecR domain-containing protein [Chitinophagaceae bacterium]|nr:FecR domain-containing protein [Chitinophagaceae bacterium]